MIRETRIAMWSGPRNISTAMMRAWENRGDTEVWDEPLYAYYLKTTGLDHPGAEEIIAQGEPDWRQVVKTIGGPIPNRKAIFFQKHMTHHLLRDVDWSWLDGVSNCFLIRSPIEVVASYVKTRPNASVYDVGVLQQAEIFEYVKCRTGIPPVVMDSSDVLQDPRGMLMRLCEVLEVPFSERMLSWYAGARDSDGVWAKYWYASVWESTGFAPYRPRTYTLPTHLEKLVEECETPYRALYDARLRP